MKIARRLRVVVSALVIAATGLLLPRSVAAAPPIIVGDGGPAGCTEASLQDALFIASIRGGGTIRFRCGDAPFTLKLDPWDFEVEPFGSVSLTIPNNTTIDGGGLITIEGNLAKTTMLVPAGITASLTRLSITGAILTPAIFNQGTLTVSDITVAHNGGDNDGNGIKNFGTLAVKNSTFLENHSEFGAIWNQGMLTVDHSAFIRNGGAGSESGGISNRSTGSMAEVKNSIFSGNAGVEGGGIFNRGGTLTVDHCEFTGNQASDGGGAIASEGTLFVKNSIFSTNSAYIVGGAINGSAEIENSEFVGNSSGFFGGALAGGFIIRNSTFSGNITYRYGGAIIAFALTITNSTITGNVAGTDGGGISMIGGVSPTLIRTSVTGNTPNDIVP